MKGVFCHCAAIALTVGAAKVSADPLMQCGGALIEAGVGTTETQVVEKCGAPDEKDGNRWIYQNHNGGNTMVIHFDGGQVSRIQELME